MVTNISIRYNQQKPNERPDLLQITVFIEIGKYTSSLVATRVQRSVWFYFSVRTHALLFEIQGLESGITTYRKGHVWVAIVFQFVNKICKFSLDFQTATDIRVYGNNNKMAYLKVIAYNGLKKLFVHHLDEGSSCPLPSAATRIFI